MKHLQWIIEVIEIGLAVLAAIREGRKDQTVWDALPDKYKDQERLKELEAQARKDYA